MLSNMIAILLAYAVSATGLEPTAELPKVEVMSRAALAAEMTLGVKAASDDALELAALYDPVARTILVSDELDLDGPVGHEVLAVLEQTGQEMGSLAAALRDDAFAAQWNSYGTGDDPPDVDFDRSLVVTITIPDDACPPDFTGFERSGSDGAELVPRFVETAEACDQPLIPKTYVVTIDRSTVPDRFDVVLPADEVFRLPEARLTIDTGAPDAPGFEAPTDTDPDDEPDALPGEAVDVPPSEGAALLAVGLPVGEFVNVYERPDESSAVVAEVVWDDDIVATGHNRQVDDVRWTQVEFDGVIGWVESARLLVEGRTRDNAYPQDAELLRPPPATETLDQLALEVGAPFVSDSSTSSITIVAGPSSIREGRSTMAVDALGIGDDSVGGARLVIVAEQIDGRWTLVELDVTDLCRRGAGADGTCI